jgi:hypothetical protein
VNAFVGVKFIVSQHTAASESKAVVFGFSDNKKIPYDTDQNESNGHEGAIGIERPADNYDQQESDYDTGFWTEFKSIMLGGVPFEEKGTKIGGKGLMFHKNYAMKCMSK